MDKKIRLSLVLMLLLVGCSSMNPNIGNSPSIPDSKVPLVGIPSLNAIDNLSSSLPQASVASEPIEVALHSIGGAVLTIWAKPRKNWLWGYTIDSSNSFGENRNWIVIPNIEGMVQFKNVVQGTCITSFKNGVIHDTCNSADLNQLFELIPTINGNFVIKNRGQERCLKTEFNDRTILSPFAFTIIMDKCPTQNQEVTEELWAIYPPIKVALATLIIPSLRPAPVPPIYP